MSSGGEHGALPTETHANTDLDATTVATSGTETGTQGDNSISQQQVGQLDSIGEPDMATVAEGRQNQVESITSSDIVAPLIVQENAAQLEPCTSNEPMNEEQHHSPVQMTTAEESAQSGHMDAADADVLTSTEAMVQQPNGKLLHSVQEIPICAEHTISATSPQVETLPTYSGDEHPIGIDSIQQDDEGDQMHSHRVSVSGTPRCSHEELMPISQIASELHCENAVEIALPEVPDSSPLDDIPVDTTLSQGADGTTSPGVAQCGIEPNEPIPSVGSLSVRVNNNPSEQIDTDADQWKEVHAPKLEVVEKEEHVLQEVCTDEEARHEMVTQHTTTESDSQMREHVLGPHTHKPVEISSTSDGPNKLQADEPETATNASKSEMEDSHSNETRNLEELVTADDDCRGKDAPESISGSAVEPPKAPKLAAKSSSAQHVSGAPATSAIVTAAPPRRVWRSTHNKCTEETDNHPSWYQHKRHLLVFTYSGKPVFTRYGSEDGLSGTTGALSAIVSKIATLFQGQTDTLRYMVAGDHIFAFLEKGPLWLVCISRCGDTYPDLVRLLERVHSQIIAILTAGVERTLQKNPGYDVRNLLGGTDNVVNNMIRWCTQDLHLQVDGFEPLPLPPAFRTVATESLRSARIQNVLCGFLLGGHRIMSIVSNRQYKVHATDLAMIINMIMSSASLKTAESWTPVCLANLNNKAFAHAYISFIEDSDVAVVFLSQISDGEQFYALSQQASNIKRTLDSTGCLAAVKDAISHCPIDLHSASADEVHRSERPARKTLLAPIASGQLQLLDFVIHAAYFIPSLQQFFSSAIAPHYRSRRKAKMLFRSYGRCRLLLRSAKMPSQICIATDHECFYVSLASEFHIYLAVPRGISTGVIGQFYQWIKSQEGHIFLDHFPVW